MMTSSQMFVHKLSRVYNETILEDFTQIHNERQEHQLLAIIGNNQYQLLMNDNDVFMIILKD